MDNIFYIRIRQLGFEQGYTLKELAEGIGVSINSMYKWKKSNISSTCLIKSARFLNSSVDYLLGLTDTPCKAYVTSLGNWQSRILQSFRGIDMTNKQADLLISVIKGIYDFNKV